MLRDLKNIVFISIALTVVILAATAASGFIYVWYRNTGFREQNSPAFKPQETAYPGTTVGAISTAGKEPAVQTPFQASQLTNPVPATSDSLGKGEQLFMTYCGPCHDSTGGGQGIMGTVPALALVSDERKTAYGFYLSGYMGEIPDIDVNFVQHESEGEIYYTITNGGESIMPSFKDALSPEQRWNLINFIKIRLGAASGK